jgi:2,4-dienoyl-CoA reductase-like NADH-dependent reductase (Old Yellow Enzyme family)
MANLNSEYKIKSKTIKNRIVFPPIVRFGLTDDTGFVTQKHVDHYEKIAKGGTGFIVVEATCIDKDGRLADTQIGVWSDEHIEGLKRIADACHRYGATVVVQIHHAGIQTPGTVIETPSGPSEIFHREKVVRALSLDEIRKIQDQFVEAAGRVKAAGFDGIEIHGAHGYLVDQFMSPVTNKREDQYGGTLENRMRFGVEIVTRIKEELGNDFIIDYRMGGNAPSLEEGTRIAKVLEHSGVDILHVSAGITGENRPEAPKGFPYNWIVYMGTEIKKNVSIPVIVVNGIRTPKQAEYLIENNLADFVAVCKAQLADHNWANKAVKGEEILNCLECPKCQWFKDGRRCPRSKNN